MTKPITMRRAVAALVRANVPVLLMGIPGAGKTKVVESWGRAWGRHVETIASGAREPVDFMGLPMEAEVDGVSRVVYSPLSWALELGQADKGLLVVDEITTAQSTFKAFLRILEERYVGEYKLPDSVAIIAIGNPPEIAVDGVDLPAPVANRFAHLEWQTDREEWMANVGTGFTQVEVPDPDTFLAAGTLVERARVVSLLTGFLRMRPDLLEAIPEDVVSMSGAWPSLRAWSNAIDALTYVPGDDADLRDLILTSLLGQGVASQVIAWLEEADLADPAEVLSDPTRFDWATTRADRVFGLLNGIMAIVDLDGSADLWTKGLAAVTACATAGRPDVAMPAARSLANRDHARRHGIPDDFREAFADLFERTGLLETAA